MIQRYLEKYPQEMTHEYLILFLFSILKAIKSVFFLWCLQSAIVFKLKCGFETLNSSGSQLACHGVNFVNVTCNYIHM